MRESDENDDGRAESTSAATTDDVGLARTDRDADRMDEAAIEDVFEAGAMPPSVVEASVDALFERFEEDSPEEVMLADRFPAESDVVPTPPAFDEFAADVTGDAGEFDGSVGRVRGDESVPAPEDVVGFEDAPGPTTSDDPADVDATPTERSASTTAQSATLSAGPSGAESVDAESTDSASMGAGTESVDVNADAASFEWVSEPVVTETVLANPEAARAFAGVESGEEEGSAGVLSELRSSFPF